MISGKQNVVLRGRYWTKGRARLAHS